MPVMMKMVGHSVSIDLDAKGGSTFDVTAGTKDAIGKPMATVFIEYKPTDKKDANGKTIMEKKRGSGQCGHYSGSSWP